MLIARGAVVILLISVIFSGLLVVYAKYNSRLIFIDIQKSEHELEYLEIVWERLTIEERMLSDYNRVEKIGRDTLDLTEVKRQDIRYIKF